MPEATKTLFRGKHPADVPLYSLADVVRCLRRPRQRSVRAWPFDPVGQFSLFDPHPEQRVPLTFTFRALVNVFLLGSGANWWAVVTPFDDLFGSEPGGLLLSFDHGSAVLVPPGGDMLPVEWAGAGTGPNVGAAHKARVEWEGDTPVRLYPFSRAKTDEHSPRLIVIDPRVGFGNPVLAGRNIRTDVIASRFRAGESVAELAEDLDIPSAEVEEAIRFESGYRA